MKRREFIVSSVAGRSAPRWRPGSWWLQHSEDTVQPQSSTTRKILIAGGNYNTAVHPLHGATDGQAAAETALPADGVGGFAERHHHLYRNCAPLNVEPSHQISFIASTQQPRSWEDVFLSVDGIVCSGGNTLNQQAIWKAQGIDVILRQAWDRGIVLGGASAGSLCWFEEGTTDSRPKELSKVDCLGFLKGSHSPHYDAEPGRRPLYQKMIALGSDEARLRVRQRCRHLFRRQRRQARGVDSCLPRRCIT